MAEIDYSIRRVHRFTTEHSTLAAISVAFAAFAAVALLRPATTRAQTPQATIVLNSASAMTFQHDDTRWQLDNSGGLDWTVTVTKAAVNGPTIDVDGFIAVTNSGKGGATIDNVVVNLQSQCRGGWASAAADIADIMHGVHAAYANIVAAASSEDPALNAQCRSVANYKVTPLTGQSALEGTFFTSAASGPLRVKARGNSIFAQRPRFKVQPTQTARLFFTAGFDNTILGFPVGTPLRAEIIVSFNNAGGSGGSGFLAFGIDTDGDEGPATGVITTDQSDDDLWARSIGFRRRALLAAPIHANARVTLADPEGRLRIVSGGGALSNFSTEIGGGTGSELIRGGTLGVGGEVVRAASVTLTPAPDGATLGNCASLRGVPRTVALAITDPLTGLPLTHQFPVGIPASLAACNLASVMGNAPRFAPGSFCTYTQREWAEPPVGGNAGSVLANHFAAQFPDGVHVGVSAATCAAGAFDNKFTSPVRIGDYLARRGTPAPLTACQTNATDDTAGALGGEVLALALNVDFNDGGFILGTDGTSFGDLLVCGTGTRFDGKSVAQALKIANRVLAGGALPAGATVATVRGVAAALNGAFDSCAAPSSWAELHLAKGGCP
jgi:hypothetical protein